MGRESPCQLHAPALGEHVDYGQVVLFLSGRQERLGPGTHDPHLVALVAQQGGQGSTAFDVRIHQQHTAQSRHILRQSKGRTSANLEKPRHSSPLATAFRTAVRNLDVAGSAGRGGPRPAAPASAEASRGSDPRWMGVGGWRGVAVT